VSFPPPDIAALCAAADENLVAHAGWLARRMEGMRVLADEQLVIVDSGLPCDTFNFVLRARLEPATAEGRIREALEHFREARRPFSWWVGPVDRPRNLGGLLLAAGLERAEGELAMAADLAALPPPGPAPPGLHIEPAVSAAQLRDFASLNAANWTPPDAQVGRFYERGATLLLSKESPLRFYVGYLEGVPVATSEATIAGGVVGLYNLSTQAACRRRGIGTAMTLRPLLDARANGLTTAILQAAPEGVGLYRRLGFVPIGEITEYKPPIDTTRPIPGAGRIDSTPAGG
jgi:ribosomal protein S18 acetylase RimI-like enzyme